MTHATASAAEVLLDLAIGAEPKRLAAVGLIAAMTCTLERLEKEIARLEDEAAAKAETITALRRELEIEQGKVGIVGIDHKKMADQLATARNLLADWLEHGLSGKNIDATEDFLKELSE